MRESSPFFPSNIFQLTSILSDDEVFSLYGRARTSDRVILDILGCVLKIPPTSRSQRFHIILQEFRRESPSDRSLYPQSQTGGQCTGSSEPVRGILQAVEIFAITKASSDGGFNAIVQSLSHLRRTLRFLQALRLLCNGCHIRRYRGQTIIRRANFVCGMEKATMRWRRNVLRNSERDWCPADSWACKYPLR